MTTELNFFVKGDKYRIIQKDVNGIHFNIDIYDERERKYEHFASISIRDFLEYLHDRHKNKLCKRLLQ